MAASCNQLDATRVTPPKATLGDDLYGVFCDRLGASSFTEDLSGASYRSICHYDSEGHYGDKVDGHALPTPTTDAEAHARQLSIAKLERLAQRRGDVVHAINATFPEVSIDDVTAKDPGAKIRLHDALSAFAQDVTPLYETNPIDAKAEPLLPMQTRSLARLLGAITAPGGSAARDALSKMWGRRGYRPFQLGLGLARTALAYPDLHALTTSMTALVAPGGAASAELQQALLVLKQELATMSPTVPPLPTLTIDPATGTLGRPRSDLEFAQALLLSKSDAFAPSATTAPAFIALRDRRGIVVPSGNAPGTKGTVLPPFVDLNDDGYADVDAFGRFVDASAAPLPLDTPFGIPGETKAGVDAFGRPAGSAAAFTYLDTQRTLVGALAEQAIPLLDPTVETAPGDPNGWQSEHETLMYALAGAALLAGDRETATYDYGAEGKAGKPVMYRRFNPDTSPLPDLLHAAGQVLADEDSDAILLAMIDLLKNHESTVARLMGALLRVREIADQHDGLASMGLERPASLAYEVPVWDEMAQVVNTITGKPGLTKALLAALADDTVVTPQSGVKHMGEAIAKFARFRDELTYDKIGTHYDGSPGGINGRAVNLTVDPSGADTSDPKTPVDNLAPKIGKNRSCLQRSFMLIADADGGPACNKDGATVAAKLGPISTTWPVTGFPVYASPYKPCELFRFDNLGVFYLDSLLPPDHPKRSFLQVKAPDLNDLLGFFGGLGVSIDDLLEQSSDIAGLTQHPEPSALSRLVWFGASSADYSSMPDLDLVNRDQRVDAFVSGSIEPLSAAWCPPDATPNAVPTCSDKSGTLRVRDQNSIFLWERFGFTTYLQPVVIALANSACAPDLSSCDTSDVSGEKIFLAINRVLNRHWPGADHGPECSKTDPAIYCSGAGLNQYEPILADAFESDLVPALHEIAKVATELSSIRVQRGPKKGDTWTLADALEKLTKILFDQDYAASVGMVDRHGTSAGAWVDGTPQEQVTPFMLFADGMHGIDTRFTGACDNAGAGMATCLADAAVRHGQWKRARSQLVDAFLAVDTSGATPAFKNRSATPALVTLLELVREQLNARCPDRENGVACTWAKKDLGDALAGVMSRPLFAAVMDLQEKIRQDEGSRRAVESFLTYALASATDGGEARQGALASMADLLQVLADDGDLAPVLQAIAGVASPNDDPAGPGAASASIEVLKALADPRFDRYRVLDHVLPNLVSPMGGTKLSPLEIFMDVIADVSRIDASDEGALAPDDYGAIAGTVQGFLSDETRGLEQFYTILQKRPRP